MNETICVRLEAPVKIPAWGTIKPLARRMKQVRRVELPYVERRSRHEPLIKALEWGPNKTPDPPYEARSKNGSTQVRGASPRRYRPLTKVPAYGRDVARYTVCHTNSQNLYFGLDVRGFAKINNQFSGSQSATRWLEGKHN